MKYIGRLIFKLAWPFWVVYFRIFYHRSRVVLICDGRILLVKSYLSSKDIYDLPGGGSKRHEAWDKTAVRELHEETGITIDVADIKHLLDRQNSHHCIKYASHIFVCYLDKQPPIQLQHFELSDYGWFLPEEISTISISADTKAALTQLSW